MLMNCWRVIFIVQLIERGIVGILIALSCIRVIRLLCFLLHNGCKRMVTLESTFSFGPAFLHNTYT